MPFRAAETVELRNIFRLSPRKALYLVKLGNGYVQVTAVGVGYFDEIPLYALEFHALRTAVYPETVGFMDDIIADLKVREAADVSSLSFRPTAFLTGLLAEKIALGEYDETEHGDRETAMQVAAKEHDLARLHGLCHVIGIESEQIVIP